jgi:hypothetical protein
MSILVILSATFVILSAAKDLTSATESLVAQSGPSLRSGRQSRDYNGWRFEDIWLDR